MSSESLSRNVIAVVTNIAFHADNNAQESRNELEAIISNIDSIKETFAACPANKNLLKLLDKLSAQPRDARAISSLAKQILCNDGILVSSPHLGSGPATPPFPLFSL
jgi:hypothetical protein